MKLCTTDFQVGDTVVLFYWTGYPISHNSRAAAELGGDGCRGRITKIGSKLIHLTSLGADWKAYPKEDGKHCFVLQVEDAKKRHAQNFKADVLSIDQL